MLEYCGKVSCLVYNILPIIYSISVRWVLIDFCLKQWALEVIT